MTNTNEITNEIKEAIKSITHTDENGREVIALGNCRLDFSKMYFFNGFTRKGVKLSWKNGSEEINVIGKVEYNPKYNDFAFYTEGWSYIEHLKLGVKQ
jgi:hypothetical protein